MKKVKIKQRIDNAVNAFFDADEENFNENHLSFVNNSALQKTETAERLNQKGDVLVKILKRGFVFLPGALYLFFGTMSILFFDFLRSSPLAITMIFLLGGFMTMFGIGNIKNPKHLLIPASIIALAVAIFSLFSAFGISRYVFEYGIYFFPLVLIIPILAKDWVDGKGKHLN